MSADIETRLKKIIVERLFLNIPPEQIENDKSLTTTYGIDSVSLLELVVGMEEEFGISVADTDFKISNFDTVSALSNFVRERLEESQK